MTTATSSLLPLRRRFVTSNSAGSTGVLAEPDGLTVEQDQQRVVHAAEMQNDATAFPVARDLEHAAIDAGQVGRRKPRWLLGEGHLDIGVVRLVPVIPASASSWHTNTVPFAGRFNKFCRRIGVFAR